MNKKAFPMTHPSENNRHVDSGMDLRDYFAAKAMQALAGDSCYSSFQAVAFDAYKTADAMMEARKQ